MSRAMRGGNRGQQFAARRGSACSRSCLHGIEGLLTQRNKNKLVISIESIQRSLAMEIQGYEVEMA